MTLEPLVPPDYAYGYLPKLFLCLFFSLCPKSKLKMSEEAKNIVLEVTNQMGVHARPAAMIVRIANNYSGEIWVEKDGERVNGKSIMGIMMLAAGRGTELTFHADCENAEDFCNEMTKLFVSNFQEE
jgi:phosphocarrier protein|tara:strand:+ start:105 stop:485 length:381 start_codon:yes stop_codon:yes gene_type:complete